VPRAWCAVLAYASWALQLRAEQSNRPDASQQGVAVVSEGALDRTGESSLPEALSGSKQAHAHTKRQVTQERLHHTPPTAQIVRAVAAGPGPLLVLCCIRLILNDFSTTYYTNQQATALDCSPKPLWPCLLYSRFYTRPGGLLGSCSASRGPKSTGPDRCGAGAGRRPAPMGVYYQYFYGFRLELAASPL
jgi:hypothetical protein